MLRLAVLLLLFLVGTARGVILRPFKDTQGADVALVVLAGANVPAARYAPLGRAIQKALAPDLRLWVGIPDEDMVRARGGLAACLLDDSGDDSSCLESIETASIESHIA